MACGQAALCCREPWGYYKRARWIKGDLKLCYIEEQIPCKEGAHGVDAQVPCLRKVSLEVGQMIKKKLTIVFRTSSEHIIFGGIWSANGYIGGVYIDHQEKTSMCTGIRPEKSRLASRTVTAETTLPAYGSFNGSIRARSPVVPEVEVYRKSTNEWDHQDVRPKGISSGQFRQQQKAMSRIFTLSTPRQQ